MRALLLTAIAAPIVLSAALPCRAQAQARMVQGTITDSKGEPLIGAGVRVKNTQVGTTVDANGHYSISVPEGSDALIVNFIGMSPQEVAIGNRATVDVVLRGDSQSLNDVVVVGYGSVKKSDLTGSVASIKSQELLVGTPLSLDRGLQGKVAGVQVTQNDGAPGAGINMQIRGLNSFGSNTQPLYVIDGVPLQVNNEGQSGSSSTSSSDNSVQSTNVLNFLRPTDIESIEILKDASATSIYGSRGANGVVIITTKRGQSGQDRVDVTYRTGFDERRKKLKVLDAQTYASYLNEKYLNSDKYYGTTYEADMQLPFPGTTDPNSGIYHPAPADFAGKSTDWQDIIFHKGVVNEASVLFSGGGGDKGSFALSGNYINQNGTIVNSRFEQGNLRLNVTRNATKWLTFETNTQLSRSLNKLVKAGTSNNESGAGVVYAALRFAPTVPLDNSVLGILAPDQFPTTNPYVYTHDVKNQELVNSVFSSNSLVATIRPGLTFRSRLGLNYYRSDRNIYYPRNTFEGAPPVSGVATVSSYNQFELTSENYFTYTRKFGEKHDLTAVADYSYTNTNYNTTYENATGFQNDALQDNNLFLATKHLTRSGRGETTLLSYLGRVNYTFNGRYLFTLSGRIDGSSVFAKNNKYAPFGAAAFAWRAIEEDFLKNSTVLSDLKFRASYGTSGNQAIGPYQSLARLSGDTYVFNGNLAQAYYPTSLASPDLTWETTNQLDLGVDVAILKGRVSFTADVYDKQTHNLLQALTLPPNTGYGSLFVNAGQIQNRGLELALNGRVIDTGNFKWTASPNISFNRNKIVELGASKTVDFSPRISAGPEIRPFILLAGQPIGRIYGYQEDGIFQDAAQVKASYPTFSDEQVQQYIGEIRYKDLNGDGIIDVKDQQVIGNVNPRYVFGFNNTFNYKSLDLTVFFQGSVGNDIINYTKAVTNNLGATRGNNITQDAYDNRWTPENPNGTNRKAVYQDAIPLLFSNRFVEKGTYVRLKNVSLGYNFDFQNYGIRSLRVYTSLTNLVTWTNYSGYDPEVNAYGQNSALRGVDLGNYPTSRSFSAGINVGF